MGWFNVQPLCHGLTVNTEVKSKFVGFKTTPADAARYKEAAERHGGVSSMARNAIDTFLGEKITGTARSPGEAALLAAVRRDADLAADLTSIAAASKLDADARGLVRRLAAVLARGRKRKP